MLVKGRGHRRDGSKSRRIVRGLIILAIAVAGLGRMAAAQQPEAAKRGVLLDVPVPLTDDATDALLRQLKELDAGAGGDGRLTVVLRHGTEGGTGRETRFEAALELARAMTSADLRRLKLVSWVEGEIVGHSTLPLLASDLLLVGPEGVVADASAGEASMDETIGLSYGAIARRRALFPEPVVEALVDPGAELAWVTRVDGSKVFAAGETLEELRAGGEVLEEEIWSPAGVPLRLDARRLRSARIAAQLVRSREQVAELLDLAELETLAGGRGEGEASGALLEIVGSIAANRSRRWQSNLNATLESGETNTWLIAIDSSGGDLAESAGLAGWFSQPAPPLRTVAGVIRGEARGDAALLAMACRPLLMTPESTLGGPGSEAIDPDDVARYDELIEQVARETNRSAALIRGLLDRQSEVYRFVNRKTGRVRYATEEDLLRGADDPELERERWERGERVELAEGLSVEEAVALGLADGQTQSLESAARRIGLEGIPPPVSDRQIVRFVEKIGRSNTLAFFLLFLGFIMLSSEASAPGLGIPGFLSIVCFACFFWIKFLAGTAEWLELLAFAVGIICIGIEVFLIPGFGVFGIGGLALTMLGVVLMSQTFVIPRNVYQVEVLTRGVWIALGSFAGLIAGFALIRTMLPHVPLFRGLVMETPTADVDARERLADFAHLMGQAGVSTTPLRPSGKAQFGDQIVGVVSDGAAIGAGQPVRVVQVFGNRIVVEEVES